MVDRVTEFQRPLRFHRPVRRLVACVALGVGALVALTLHEAAEPVPLLAMGLAVLCGLCKVNTP